MRLVKTGSLFGIALSLAATACASADTGSAHEHETAELPATLTIFPSKIYIGFDGTNVYKAPIIAVSNKKAVTWTIDDPTVASLDTASKDPAAEADGINLMLTALKAGNTKLHATDGTQQAEATITVLTYTKAQYDAGKARYAKGPNDKNPACMECHAPGKGPDHTPTELDADTDEEIQDTFVSGKDPEGRPVDYEMNFTTLLKGYKHMWEVTPDEKVGLVAYLRALKPLAFPEFDAPTTEK
jgi:hypothetical protein